jgi:hypothetical protein
MTSQPQPWSCRQLQTRNIISICISVAAAVLITRVVIFSPSFSSELKYAAVDTHLIEIGHDLATEIEKLRQENKELKEKYANCNSGNDGHDDEAIVKELYDTLSPEKLLQLSTKFKSTYASAKPFPHIAIDDMFPTSILKKVIQEHPESSLENECIPGSMCFRHLPKTRSPVLTGKKGWGPTQEFCFHS